MFCLGNPISYADVNGFQASTTPTYSGTVTTVNGGVAPATGTMGAPSISAAAAADAPSAPSTTPSATSQSTSTTNESAEGGAQGEGDGADGSRGPGFFDTGKNIATFVNRVKNEYQNWTPVITVGATGSVSGDQYTKVGSGSVGTGMYFAAKEGVDPIKYAALIARAYALDPDAIESLINNSQEIGAYSVPSFGYAAGTPSMAYGIEIGFYSDLSSFKGGCYEWGGSLTDPKAPGYGGFNVISAYNLLDSKSISEAIAGKGVVGLTFEGGLSIPLGFRGLPVEGHSRYGYTYTRTLYKSE